MNIFTHLNKITLLLFINILFTITAFAEINELFKNNKRPEDTVRLEFIDFNSIITDHFSFVKQKILLNSKPSIASFISVQDKKDVTNIPLSKIREVYYDETQNLTFASDKSAKCLHLTGALNEDELLSGWNRDLNYTMTKWKPVSFPRAHSKWIYIPQAAWIWKDSSWYKSAGESTFFRQEFTIPNNAVISAGYLTLSADEQVDKLFINGKLINADFVKFTEAAKWDITYLLRNGKNFIAVKVKNSSDPSLNPAGVAYRIDVTALATKSTKINKELPEAVAFLINGDVIRGDLRKISDDSVTIDSVYGSIVIDRDWIKKLILNYETGYLTQHMKKFGIKKVLAPVTSPSKQQQKELDVPNVNEREKTAIGVLLKNGTFVDGRVLRIKKENLFLKPQYGNTFSIPVYSVDSIYFSGLEKSMYYQYPRDVLPLTSKVTLVNNDTITGIIENISADSVTISLPYSNKISIDSRYVLHCKFVYSLLENLTEDTKPFEKVEGENKKVGIIGEFDFNDLPLSEDLFFQSSQVADYMGLGSQVLSINDFLDHLAFSPEVFPILINLDQHQQFYQTVKKESDGLEALINYEKKEGGCIVNMGTGFPFFYGLVPEGKGWKKQVVGKTLTSQLGLNIKNLGEASEDFIPFERPNNENKKFFFTKNSSVEFTEFLPEKVEFPLTDDTSFKPIASPETNQFSYYPLYNLTDEKGKSYGPAMAIIKYKEKNNIGYAIYISPLLINAKYEDESMVRYLLPVVFNAVLSQK